jgi:large repetitive protein
VSRARAKTSGLLRYASLVATAVATAVALLVLAPVGVADDLPTLSIADDTRVEGETAGFTVTLSGAASEDVTVHYRTADGSARAGQDFAETEGDLTIPAGQTSGMISVQTTQDAIDEVDETFVVNLSAPVGAMIGDDGQALGSIADDDAPPSISISDAAADEGNADHELGFEVRLSQASGKAISVEFFTESDSARADEDFVRVADGTLSFAPGEDTKSIAITIKGDASPEADETFTVRLRDAQNASISDDAATGTIRNDDEAPTVSISDAQADEADGDAVKLAFKVTLSGPSGQTIRVTATTSDGTATAPADYAAKSQVLTFNPGETERPFEVSVAGDTLDEPNEIMHVTLSDATGGATIGAGEAVGRIFDHDATSVLSISDSTVAEPRSGTALMTFTVTLAPASARLVRVGYSTADGTATAPADYVATSGFVELAPGETKKSITVTIQGDTLGEPNETLFVNLGGADGARVGDDQGLGTIGDATAPPTLAISDTTAQEGEAATLVVTLTGSTTQAVTVRFATVDGSATAPGDYLGRTGTVTFAPGEKSKQIAFTVVDDTDSEPDEAFSVRLDEAVNATIVKPRGDVLILASDRAPAAPNDPPAPPAPPAARPLNPRMVLSPKTVVVTRRGVARLQLSCLRRSPLTCRGSVALETVAAPKRVLGRAAFTARPGRRVPVNVKLTLYGRNLLARRKSLRVRVRMTIRASGSRVLRVSPGVITLKAPRDDVSVPVR